MGRKKRQGEPNMEEDNDSTESCDENQNGYVCNHIARGVDLSKIKKVIRNGLSQECPECEKNPVENGTMESDYEYDLSLWLCLKCGNQACGRSKRKHALSHWRKPHSDCHALCVNTTLWTVWCYDCDNMINPSSKKKLLEVVEYLKKQTVVNNISKKPIPLDFPVIDTSTNDSPTDNYKNISSTSTCHTNLDLPRVRGLTNLGNTCFFNAVCQCLAQTPFLLPVLQELSNPGERFILPGGKLAKDEKDTQPKQLPPMEGTLTEWGTLTEVLCNNLKELTSGRMDVHNPRSLLSELTHRHPQFAGGDQHDSHELLRHLLEAVRSEDLRRYQTVILEHLGFSRKTDPSTVEGYTKQIIKFYGQQASDLMIRTDQVFRGVLVSTLQCQDCKHSSHRDEFFFDLSLPVADRPIPPAFRRVNDTTEQMETENKPSKYQLKKEKKAARRTRKHQKHNQNYQSGTTIVEEQTNDNNVDSEESDADVEDNIEECRSPGNCEETKGIESGYNSEKVSDASPELNASEIDSGVTSPLMVNVPSPMCNADSPSSGSSETNIEMPSPITNIKNDFQNPDDYERPISRLSFTDKPTPMDISTDSKSSINDSDSRLSDQRWTDTITARYQCDEGECSVQSCLNQFTACELMTGNNKVGCENCTKMINGEGGKTVYTNATKQLLISSPPAILILHLKRFQIAARCFPRKITKHVTFPLVLDMAPFCSSRCRDLPSIHDDQNRLLYSLYGIVEHSGNLHGGHYVAYVKVRPKVSDDSYRWQFLTRPSKCGQEIPPPGAQAEPSPPPGKWYYVSDSYVAEVPESKVLKAQAYLLFYERIL